MIRTRYFFDMIRTGNFFHHLGLLTFDFTLSVRGLTFGFLLEMLGAIFVNLVLRASRETGIANTLTSALTENFLLSSRQFVGRNQSRTLTRLYASECLIIPRLNITVTKPGLQITDHGL